jgi:hypothetical protein
MEKLDHDVLCVNTLHCNPFGSNVDSKAAGRLKKVFPICIGACVMFIENLWTAVELVNGVMGIIEEDRLMQPDVWRTFSHLIMVRLEDYTGLAYFEYESEGLSSALRETMYIQGTQLCTQTQFALAIA